jgi:hypothetical protein
MTTPSLFLNLITHPHSLDRSPVAMHWIVSAKIMPNAFLLFRWLFRPNQRQLFVGLIRRKVFVFKDAKGAVPSLAAKMQRTFSRCQLTHQKKFCREHCPVR